MEVLRRYQESMTKKKSGDIIPSKALSNALSNAFSNVPLQVERQQFQPQLHSSTITSHNYSSRMEGKKKIFFLKKTLRIYFVYVFLLINYYV